MSNDVFKKNLTHRTFFLLCVQYSILKCQQYNFDSTMCVPVVISNVNIRL